MLDKAIRIAATAHEGQLDKAGEPYILHPLRVMFEMESKDEMICAVLHDVIEDSDRTLESIEHEGFSQDILKALKALTKKPGESYDEFITRVIQDETACKVKLADLKDNMDLSRFTCPKHEDYERAKKYKKAAERIIKAYKD